MRRTTLAARFFWLVFGLSAAWFTITTGAQLILEYRNTRVELDANLVELFAATRTGLESALWNYDLALVRTTLDLTSTVRSLSGAVVSDDQGGVVASWGEVPPSGSSEQNVDSWSEPVIHRFGLRYRGPGVAQELGTLVLVSGLDIVTSRLAGGFRLIVSSYLANVAGFLVILTVILGRVVAGPLRRMTRAIGAYRFDQSLTPLKLPRPDELSVLWQSFEELTGSLKESWLQQRVLSSILEEAAVMALVCDANGRIVSSNAQARARLGSSAIGDSLADLTYGSHPDHVFFDVPRLLTAGAAWRDELTVQGGENRAWLSVALLPLAVPDEPRARWGVMIEDVSDKRLTEHYRLERDLARETARTKSVFLANLSHEIRTPMNAVVGLTSLALKEEISPRVRGYLAPLERSAKALLGVINDILDYSKLEEGKVDLESVDFDLHDLLRDVEAMVLFRAEEKGLTLSIRGPDQALPLRGDPLRLQQVLLNLVSNAVKFTERGSVQVVVLKKDGLWRFEVRDTGIGIPESERHRLFQSFSQVDASTTRVYGGTGLGLSIVRQLVDLMGGRLGVESNPGEGSVFWVELELAEGAPVPPADRPEWTGLGGLRLLLAEDNAVNQLVAKEILSKMGVELVVVANGEKAVEAVENRPFDLVLMDLQMPVMDGLTAARKIRLRHPDLVILAMTAHALEQEKADCLEAGMQDVVAKPVDPDALYAALKRWAVTEERGRGEVSRTRGDPS